MTNPPNTDQPLDLDAIEARHAKQEIPRMPFYAEEGLQAHADRAALLAEVRKLREALAFIEGKACTHENLYPNCGFEAIENIANQALKAPQS